jgi:hypothetical protein
MKYSLFLIAAVGVFGLAATFYKYDHPTKAASSTYETPASDAGAKTADLVVHEWGTFTSIAGKNGFALDWRPLNGPSDLPKFVYSDADSKGYRGTYSGSGKGDIARIRMETPVIYFYAKKAMEVNVKVRFPEGRVTEWYPQAGVVNRKFGERVGGGFENGTPSSGINWGTIKLVPDEIPNYMREAADSHYYPARETDSTAIQVCNADKTRIEKEKFLFYRGIGNFKLPLKVRTEGDSLILGTTEDKYLSKGHPYQDLSNLIVFENRGGRVGYTVVPAVSVDTTVGRPQLDKTLTDVYAELEKTLISQGLYEKEARAMIETWKDSWFEDGLRVFYVLPRMTTDEVLPLTVEPLPRETIRVLVGRTEVITPEMEKDVLRQVGLLNSKSAAVRREAEASLKTRGRFYEPILHNVLKEENDPNLHAQIERLIALK